MSIQWRYASHDYWTADPSTVGRYTLIIQKTLELPWRTHIYLVEALWPTGAVVPIARSVRFEDAQAAAETWADEYEAKTNPGSKAAQAKGTP